MEERLEEPVESVTAFIESHKACPSCGRDFAPVKQPLTKKQAYVLTTIRIHIDNRGCAPTLQFLADHYNNALSSMWAIVDTLEKKGHIKKDKRSWQSMEIL